MLKLEPKVSENTSPNHYICEHECLELMATLRASYSVNTKYKKFSVKIKFGGECE